MYDIPRYLRYKGVRFDISARAPAVPSCTRRTEPKGKKVEKFAPAEHACKPTFRGNVINNSANLWLKPVKKVPTQSVVSGYEQHILVQKELWSVVLGGRIAAHPAAPVEPHHHRQKFLRRFGVLKSARCWVLWP